MRRICSKQQGPPGFREAQGTPDSIASADPGRPPMSRLPPGSRAGPLSRWWCQGSPFWPRAGGWEARGLSARVNQWGSGAGGLESALSHSVQNESHISPDGSRVGG